MPISLAKKRIALAKQIAGYFAYLPQVTAIALGGSNAIQPMENKPNASPAKSGEEFLAKHTLHGTLHTTPKNNHNGTLGSWRLAEKRSRPAFPQADEASDIDILVFTNDEIPIAEREKIMRASGGAYDANLGLHYFGPRDEWNHSPSGIEVDMVYFRADWMSEHLIRVLEKHQPSIGYTTAHVHTMQNAVPLYDPSGWLATQQNIARQPYPLALARAIVQHNHPLLRGIIHSYQGQILKALKRGDLPSINHRVAALLASYFDILYAANGIAHPGEKRMAQTLLQVGAMVPADMQRQLNSLLLLGAADLATLPENLSDLLDSLDEFLRQHNWLPIL